MSSLQLPYMVLLLMLLVFGPRVSNQRKSDYKRVVFSDVIHKEMADDFELQWNDVMKTFPNVSNNYKEVMKNSKNIFLNRIQPSKVKLNLLSSTLF
jgi:hypothetical protein